MPAWRRSPAAGDAAGDAAGGSTGIVEELATRALQKTSWRVPLPHRWRGATWEQQWRTRDPSPPATETNDENQRGPRGPVALDYHASW